MADLSVSIGADATEYNRVMGSLGTTAQTASSEVTKQLAQSANAMTSLGGATVTASMRMQQMRSATATLRDGLIGVSIGGQAGERALMAMGHHLSTIYNETGSVVGVLNVLKSSLFSFGGVILIISAAAEIYSKFAEATKTAKEEQSDFAKAVDSANKSASDELSKLSTLYDAATNDNLSRQERLRAVKELQKEYPGYFSNLDQETILAGKAAGAYDNLSKAIINQAVIKAGQEKLSEAIKPLVDFIAEQERQQAKLDKMNAEDQAKNPAKTQKFGLVDDNGKQVSGFTPVTATGHTNAATLSGFIQDETKEAKKAGEDQIQTYDEYQKNLRGKIQDAQNTLKKMVEDFGVNSILPKAGGGKDTSKDAFQQLQDQIDKMETVLKDSLVAGSTTGKDYSSPLVEKIRAAKEQLAQFKSDLDKLTSQRGDMLDGAFSTNTLDKRDLVTPSDLTDGNSPDILKQLQNWQKLVVAQNNLKSASKGATDQMKDEDAQLKYITGTLGTGLQSVFESALSGTQNFFDAFAKFIENLIIKLIAAIAVAALLATVLSLTGLGAAGGISGAFAGGFGGTTSGSFGSIFGSLSGMPKFADGGIVTKPTIGMFGEAGTEAVIPINKLQDFVDTNKGGGVITIQPTFTPNGVLWKGVQMAGKSQQRRT
jgi:hypothetical protein